MMTLLMGCQSSGLTTATPDHKTVQTQVIPQGTGTASFYQTQAAQYLEQSKAGAIEEGSKNDSFPYASCTISGLVITVIVYIYGRSRRMK